MTVRQMHRKAEVFSAHTVFFLIVGQRGKKEYRNGQLITWSSGRQRPTIPAPSFRFHFCQLPCVIHPSRRDVWKSQRSQSNIPRTAAACLIRRSPHALILRRALPFAI